ATVMAAEAKKRRRSRLMSLDMLNLRRSTMGSRMPPAAPTSRLDTHPKIGPRAGGAEAGFTDKAEISLRDDKRRSLVLRAPDQFEASRNPVLQKAGIATTPTSADGSPGFRYKENSSRTRQRHGGTGRMQVVDLVLPVFAVIVTGWLAGQLGYISRSLADGLVHFAYNVAMPALLFVTVAQEPARHLLEWRFLLAFGGGSILCFALVLMAVRVGWGRDLRSGTMFGMSAAMTNTGFVALPILHAIYGQPAVLPAAIATLFVAAVMFPLNVILL